jgi:NodT family efflux transporter outer membrane factor (OMF) lipoprotein
LVGPRYQTPETALEPEFLEEADSAGAEVDLKTWWTQFGDPVLDRIIDEAIVNNYDLRIAGERIAEARARYQFDWANLWPEIDLDGSAVRERVSQTLFDSSFLGPPVQNLFTIGFDASWELDFFGRLRRIKEASLDEYQATQENFRDVYVTLLAEVCRNYAALRALQQRIDLAEEQIRTAADALSLSAARFDAGLQSEIGPLESAAELEAIEASLFPLQAEMSRTLYSLAVLVGRQPEQIPGEWREASPIPKAAGRIPVGLPSDLLRRRPDIRRAERKLAAATALVGAAIAQLFPTFSLTGGFGFQSDEANTWFEGQSRTWNVGPSVAWPVIDFGRIRSKINLQNALQREALLEYEQTVLKALEEVEDALSAYAKEDLRMKRLFSQVENLRSVCDRTESLFRAGLSSFTDVLDAEREWLAARQILVSSEQALSVDLMAVYKSLGGEWECSSTP